MKRIWSRYRKIRQFVRFIVIFCISAAVVSAGGNALTTAIHYRTGSPVVLHLQYDGTIEGWDGGASLTDGILVLSNSMFIGITNSNNEEIKPIQGRVLSVWADTFFRDPFALVLDISRFYDLSRPGKYTVRWGCAGVREDRVFIEIVEQYSTNGHPGAMNPERCC